MNKLKYFLVFLVIFLPKLATAQCQLCYLNEENAKKVVSFLQMEKEFVIYYSDCSNKVKDIARRIKIDKVSYQATDREGYFEIYVEGTLTATFDIENQLPVNYVKNEMKFADVIDIAYTHIRSGGYVDMTSRRNIWDATCLGIYMGFDCDPCTDPFDYPFYN